MSDHRPVPLRYLFALKQGLMPLFRDPNAGPGGTSGVPKVSGKLDAPATINPSIIKIEEQALRNAQQKMTRTGRPFKTAKVNPQTMIPKYSDLAEELNSLKMLPAIVFIFSRAGINKSYDESLHWLIVLIALNAIEAIVLLLLHYFSVLHVYRININRRLHLLASRLGCEQAAKMVMGGRAKLLNDEETLYVTQAIAAFARANPEIPVTKSSVQMLRSGVGVHHAGLIPVWKAFIEDLFNANKIKVLFATETLAAGVNMPARTTVISTVTKRVNSEVVKLKTSQMLQMAGRAGRRGKDTEGTVVILRNRFEDVRMGHKILTSSIDGIKSHFKTSYGLTVKLLQTKTMEECRALIERGFGAYLLQQRVQKK
jgi:superfamily II RNA helicase